jgi:hypothetical protein
LLATFPRGERGVGRQKARASAHMFSLYYKSRLLATFKDFPFSSLKIKTQKISGGEKPPRKNNKF